MREQGGWLTDSALECSAVVANNAMNRERGLAGVNSYTRELGFNPVDVLTTLLFASVSGTVAWLDLCCGSGRALIQAAHRLRGQAQRVRLVGVDLVDFFDPVPAPGSALDLVCAPALSWQPDRRFDLVTCVHGLHYVGDKLTLLARAASWLTDDGLFIADLDLSSIRMAGGKPAGTPLVRELRTAGFSYDRRRRASAAPVGRP
ncbi:MAG TPA: class I SAM-dependent methyltransferase [Rugosimonospora sp.]|nr:class I SAM-dependent methyltransferase [Rugosimonospora sp.]